ncbi:MAG: O-antigen ligase family protein [Fimbriimonadaceae bacterium]
MKWAQASLLIAVALAVLSGGHVSLDAAPSAGPWLRSAMTGANEAPYGTRLVLLALVLLPLAVVMSRRQVSSLPRLPILALGSAFVILALFSSLWSAYLWPGLAAWPTLALGSGVLLLSVAVLGRREGPVLSLDVFVASVAVLAARGILEYAAVRSSEPGYRIFAGWNNPNALASILVLALPAGMARCVSSERVRALGLGAATLLIGIALALTQSKGGLVAAGVGVVACAVTVLVCKGATKKLLSMVGLAAVAALLGWTVLTNSARQAGSGPGRLANAAATSVQSAGYRVQLWKGTLQLAMQNPKGTGFGSYRYVSAKPGLTPMTFSSHQTWLQTAAETGWAGLLLFLGVFAAWLRLAVGGIRHLPLERQIGVAGCVGAVAAACAHGFVETNLAFTGVVFGIAFVMGCGLCLSNDGTTPESMPRSARNVLLVGLALPGLVFGVLAAWNERAKSEAALSMQQGDMQASLAASRRAFSTSLQTDGEALALAARVTGESDDLERAASLMPVPRTYRMLAALSESKGDDLAAASALERGLQLDPKNLPSLWRLVELYDQTGNREKAVETAERLVAIEDTPYFQIRAIPEHVPTETCRARIYLAALESGTGKRATLLRGALEQLRSYLSTTLPMIRRFAAAEMTFVGESLDSAREVSELAQAALASYREVEPDEAAWSDDYSSFLSGLDFSPSK